MGANAKGKTTILEALNDFFLISSFNPLFLPTYQEFWGLWSQYYSPSPSINTHIESDIFNIYSKYQTSIQPTLNNHEINEVLNKIKQYDNEATLEKTKSFLENISGIIANKKFQRWHNMKRFKENRSYIRVWFHDTNLGDFSIELSDKTENKTWGYYLLDKNNQFINSNNQIYLQKFEQLRSKVYFFDSKNISSIIPSFQSPSDVYNFQLNASINPELSLIELAKDLGEELTLEIIKLVDSKISEIQK